MLDDPVRLIPLALIDVPGERARSFDPVWAEALAASIAAQGLLHPVRLRAAGGRYRLVAGLHRLRAVGILGDEAAATTLSGAASDAEARLEEVMENLARQDLTALDRCQHLAELKAAWEVLHPETAHGKAPKPEKGKVARLATFPECTGNFRFLPRGGREDGPVGAGDPARGVGVGASASAAAAAAGRDPAGGQGDRTGGAGGSDGQAAAAGGRSDPGRGAAGDHQRRRGKTPNGQIAHLARSL
jgi:hypothetical protein